MIAHAIGETRRVVVASPALMKKQQPLEKDPAALMVHAEEILLQRRSSPSHWEFGEGRAAIDRCR